MTGTVIDLLRHGALEGGVRYRGSIEAELTVDGRADMDAVWAQVTDSIDVILTSPLGRCLKPALDWAGQKGIACEIVEDFREMHYGDWEGLSAEEIELRFPGMLVRWRENPLGMQIPGAERIEDFSERVVCAWDDVLRTYSGRHLLLLGHSGSLRVILAHVLAAPLPTTRRLAMPYATWSRIEESNCGYLLTHLRGLS